MVSPLRSWIVNRAPDLRITKSLVGARREIVATFTVNGVLHEVGPVTGEDADTEIDTAVARVLSEVLGLVAKGAPSLAQEIVRASLMGDEASRAALTAEYLRAPSTQHHRRVRSRWST